MAKDSVTTRIHPAAWIPTMYFAEGLPFFAISLIAGILYKRLGLPNDIIALYTSWLLLPWSLKPIWSPLLEMFKTKKFFVVLFEFAGGLSLASIALCLPLPNYFRYTVALFAVVAFCSSTHDIAADGLYIASLSAKQQAAYAGWQGGFYNVARFFSQGALVILAAFLEARFDVPHAWMAIFAGMGLLLVMLSFYHLRVLPTGAVRRSESFREMAATFWDVIASFFKKPNIILLLVFLLLYRAGEGQIVRIGPLFLVDKRSLGGLGLTTDQRSEEHTSELQSLRHLVCRLLLEKKKRTSIQSSLGQILHPHIEPLTVPNTEQQILPKHVTNGDVLDDAKINSASFLNNNNVSVDT